MLYKDLFASFLVNMSTLIGVLVDVSASMKRSIGKRRNVKWITPVTSWARSIFNLIDELIKHDVSYDNHVFAIGFGASSGHTPVFDLLNTIKIYQPPKETSCWSKREIIERAVKLIKENGAHNVDKWASMDVINESISHEMAGILYHQLNENPMFLHHFVHECLPDVCRSSLAERNSPEYFGAIRDRCKEIKIEGLSAVSSAVGGFARPENILEIIEKAKKSFVSKPGIQKTVISVHDASEILRGYTDKKELTDERIDELMHAVEYVIYGGTPLIEAMNEASRIFSNPSFEDRKKLLFILSDGMPTDGSDPPKQKLEELGVKIISCFITAENVSDPKHLYSKECRHWCKGAKFMFDLSSTIPTEQLPRTIFVKRDWKIDIDNNETKLFLQINHPDVIKDAGSFAKDVVCCQDALSDVLTNVSLDLYINQANKNFDAKEQEDRTCYANASAAVLHLAMQRIVGREGGYPDFFDLRKEIIEKHGNHGANTLKVLEEICPRYRLHVRRVDLHDALKAVSRKRPIVARFRLTDQEWKAFSRFYQINPKGILTREEIDIKRRSRSCFTHGHAVVLTSYNSESLQLMNSWGTDWANNGFFRVRNAEVLGLEFLDVFWILADLKHSEKMAYKAQGPKIASRLVESLKGLKWSEYMCPLCRRSFKVTDFEGSFAKAKCPKCEKTFDINVKGNMLALNMYLLSICR